MAKGGIPNPIERRHLIERELQPAQALKLGEAYLGEDREIEAIEFLEKAEAGEHFATLRERALESGDVFLLRQVAAATDTPPTRAEWGRVAEAAATGNKERYEAEARRQAEAAED